MTEIQLYDYQTQAVEALREHIKAGKKNIILCAPTGSGKTVVGAYLIQAAHAKGSRAIFLCDRIALIDQTSHTLDRYGIEHGVIQGNHWRWAPYRKIQVASPQTLERREWPEELDLIIVDECHTMRRNTSAKVKARDCVTIGLTATPFTEGLGLVYDAVVSVTTTNRLIEERRLSPFRIYAPTEIDMTGAKTVAGEWTKHEAGKRAIEVVGDLVENYLKYGEGKKFIAFGATIAHCEAMREQYMGAGIRAELYTSRTTDSERTAILEEFRKRDSQIRGLISVAALAKGFDVPSVSCIQIARPLKKSLAEHIQIIGRGLRHDPDDPEKVCTIIDHTGNCVRFWEDMASFFEESVHELPEDKKREATKKKKEGGESPGRRCPTCSHVHAPRPDCPECGFVYPVQQIVHQDGELSSFESSNAGHDEKQRWYSGLLGYARQRGYSDGWAYYQYKAKFVVGPSSRLLREPGPVYPDIQGWIFHRQIAYRKAKAKAGAS
jgi:DNA repair protein RadD